MLLTHLQRRSLAPCTPASFNRTHLWFDFEFDPTKDCSIGIYIHCFLAWRSALKRQCGEQVGEVLNTELVLVLLLGKALSEISTSYSGRQMVATRKRACYTV